MTESSSSIMAIILGLGVFAIIVAVGWRSVQNRRILRLQGANGAETIIVALEDDDISSVTTTTETSEPAPAPVQPVVVVNTGTADAAPAPVFGRSAARG
jgi:cytoskeletal protein RodZ